MTTAFNNLLRSWIDPQLSIHHAQLNWKQRRRTIDSKSPTLLDTQLNSTALDFTKIYNYTRRWGHAQYVADRFWKYSIKKYLAILQHQLKWLKTKGNFRINDVLICEDLTARNNWPHARITDVTLRRDGQVTFRTHHGIYRRPITKICLLEQAQ